MVLRADVHLRDLDLQFDLDRDRNGEVTWAEVTERQGELQAWLTAGITLTAGGTACALAPVDVLERGTLVNGWAEALVPGLARNIAHRELEAFGQRMEKFGEQLEQNMQQKASVLEQRGEAMCQQVG